MNENELAAIVDSLSEQQQGGATLAEAATTIRGQNPNLSATDLAQALAATRLSTAPEILPEIDPSGAVAQAMTSGDPLAGPKEIAEALKAAGYSLNEIATAIIAAGVYPDLTAYQLGTVLLWPSVFPNTTATEMRGALEAANFSAADIDAALAQLFPSPIVGPIVDGAIICFHCMGTAVNPAHLWLNGRTQDGKLELSPSAADPSTGARWKAHAQGENVFAFECLGTLVNPDFVWLYGTYDGSVFLAPRATPSTDDGLRWQVNTADGKIYTLKNLGAANPFVWLNGGTADGSVNLAPGTASPYTGTQWKAVPQFRKIGPIGIKADPFDDTDAVLKLNKPLTRLFVRSGNVLDSFEVFYGGSNTPLAHHGGGMGDRRRNAILGDDYITKVSGYYGGYHGGHCMLQLTFYTKKGQIFGPYGDMWDTDPGRTAFTLEADDDEKVVAFFGTANYYLCSIGITVQPI